MRAHAHMHGTRVEKIFRFFRPATLPEVRTWYPGADIESEVENHG